MEITDDRKEDKYVILILYNLFL